MNMGWNSSKIVCDAYKKGDGVTGWVERSIIIMIIIYIQTTPKFTEEAVVGRAFSFSTPVPHDVDMYLLCIQKTDASSLGTNLD